MPQDDKLPSRDNYRGDRDERPHGEHRHERDAPTPPSEVGSAGIYKVIIGILIVILIGIIFVGLIAVAGLMLYFRTPGPLRSTDDGGSPWAASTNTAPAVTTTPSTLTTATTAPPVRQETEEDRIKAAQEAIRRESERRKQAKFDEQKRECDQFQANPDAWLVDSSPSYYDRGIVRDYRQLVGLNILNRSQYCVAWDIRGTVEWFDSGGGSLGTTNFSVNGVVTGGSSTRFTTEAGTLTSGTLMGESSTVKVSFTSAQVGYMCLRPDYECPTGMTCGAYGYCL